MHFCMEKQRSEIHRKFHKSFVFENLIFELVERLSPLITKFELKLTISSLCEEADLIWANPPPSSSLLLRSPHFTHCIELCRQGKGGEGPNEGELKMQHTVLLPHFPRTT